MTEKLKTNISFLRTGRYRLFWLSSLLSNIGTFMQQIAQPWVVLGLSNSAFWVGLDGFAMNAPGWIFTLWGGVLADRFDRKKTVLFFQFIQFLCVLLLVILLIAGWLKVWMMIVISFLVGLTDSLSMPAFQSIIPSIVGKQDIHKAVALNSTQFNLSRILGPAIAGVVIVRFGAIVCFSVNAASYLPFFLSLYLISPNSRFLVSVKPPNREHLHPFKDFRKILVNRELRFPLLTVFVNNLFCAPLLTFSVVLLKNVFHTGATQFGWAVSAFGAGGLLGAFFIFLPLPSFLKRNVLATGVAILLGMVVVGIALNHSLYFLLALLVLTGTMLTVSNISINSFLQENAVNETRGRIASAYQLALSGGMSLGALLTGFMVSRMNISTALFINGIIAVGSQIFVLLNIIHIPIRRNRMGI